MNKLKFKKNIVTDIKLPSEFIEDLNVFLTRQCHINLRFEKRLAKKPLNNKGLDALSAFYLKQKLNIYVPTRHVNIFDFLVRCEVSFTSYCYVLADDCFHGVIGLEDLTSICDKYPKWVFKYINKLIDNEYENKYAG